MRRFSQKYPKFYPEITSRLPVKTGSKNRAYCGENPGPGKDVYGEIDPRPGIREQPRPEADIAATVMPLPAGGQTVWFEEL
jgi:hypothetical protein